MRLIDADAFDNVLKDAQTECKKNGGNFRFGVLNNVRANLAKAPTVGGWISVKDRLPEKEGQYLCWFGKNTVCKGAAIATYLEEWKAFGAFESLKTYPNVTHWMPLPEPPEE